MLARYEQLLKEMEREDNPPRLEDSNTFEWAIPGMSSKLKYPKVPGRRFFNVLVISKFKERNGVWSGVSG